MILNYSTKYIEKLNDLITGYIKEQLNSIPSIRRQNFEPALNNIIYQYCSFGASRHGTKSFFSRQGIWIWNTRFLFTSNNRTVSMQISNDIKMQFNHKYNRRWIITSQGQCTINDEFYRLNKSGQLINKVTKHAQMQRDWAGNVTKTSCGFIVRMKRTSNKLNQNIDIYTGTLMVAVFFDNKDKDTDMTVITLSRNGTHK